MQAANGKINASQDEVEKASKVANCYNFIKKFPLVRLFVIINFFHLSQPQEISQFSDLTPTLHSTGIYDILWGGWCEDERWSETAHCYC